MFVRVNVAQGYLHGYSADERERRLGFADLIESLNDLVDRGQIGIGQATVPAFRDNAAPGRQAPGAEHGIGG